jgi:hypothetical protein
MDIKLTDKDDWCTVEIDRYLKELEINGKILKKINTAKDIQESFKEHFLSGYDS